MVTQTTQSTTAVETDRTTKLQAFLLAAIRQNVNATPEVFSGIHLN